MSNPYVFIFGCPRSGTTLLQRLLDAHPVLAVLFEGCWILDLYEQCNRGTNVTSQFVRKLVAHPKFRDLNLSSEEVFGSLSSLTVMNYSDFVTFVCDLYGQKRRKNFVGDKTPRYVRHTSTLQTLWPQSKLIHIIRDGRDVCVAALNWIGALPIRSYPTWKEDPVSTIALCWERDVRLARESSLSLQTGRYYEVFYERLVSDPEDECRDICRFLEIPYSVKMLNYYQNRNLQQKAVHNARWLPVTKGLRDWRYEMSNQDLRRFEAISGGLLKELGYNLAFNSFSPDTIHDSERVRKRFSDFLSSHNKKLPGDWAINDRGAHLSET